MPTGGFRSGTSGPVANTQCSTLKTSWLRGYKAAHYRSDTLDARGASKMHVMSMPSQNFNLTFSLLVVCPTMKKQDRSNTKQFIFF